MKWNTSSEKMCQRTFMIKFGLSLPDLNKVNRALKAGTINLIGQQN
jgi:hypothetical protein